MWKIQLSRTTSYGFLASCQNLEKVNDTIQRKCPGRQKDGRTDRGQTRTDRPYFIGPLRLLLGVQKKEKKLKFKTFWNISNITEYFEKLTSFTSIIIDTGHLLNNEAQVPCDELQFQN